jgi:hypothetical protein
MKGYTHTNPARGDARTAAGLCVVRYVNGKEIDAPALRRYPVVNAVVSALIRDVNKRVAASASAGEEKK